MILCFSRGKRYIDAQAYGHGYHNNNSKAIFERLASTERCHNDVVELMFNEVTVSTSGSWSWQKRSRTNVKTPRRNEMAGTLSNPSGACGSYEFPTQLGDDRVTGHQRASASSLPPHRYLRPQKLGLVLRLTYINDHLTHRRECRARRNDSAAVQDKLL